MSTSVTIRRISLCNSSRAMVPKASGARETDARLQMPRRGLSWEPCLFQAFAQSVPHTQVPVPFFVNEASDGEARIAGNRFRTELMRLLGTFERDQRRSPVKSRPECLEHQSRKGVQRFLIAP